MCLNLSSCLPGLGLHMCTTMSGFSNHSVYFPMLMFCFLQTLERICNLFYFLFVYLISHCTVFPTSLPVNWSLVLPLDLFNIVYNKPGVVAHTFNPTTWEAEAGRFLSSRPAWSTE
jgi:tellurite resistance protein TehA-like permease